MDCHQRFKYGFIVDGLLLNSANSNDNNTIFITSIGLNNARQALMDDKLPKVFGVINLTQIRNWDLVNDESNGLVQFL